MSIIDVKIGSGCAVLCTNVQCLYSTYGRKVSVQVPVALVVPPSLVVSPRAGPLLASVEAIRVDGGDDGDVCGVDQLCDRVNTGVVTMSE